MKQKAQYRIYKKFIRPKGLEAWDGPYPTLKEAKKVFNKAYLLKRGNQDFVIVKESFTLLKWPRKTR